MSKDYYEVSRDELINRLMCLRHQKFVDFFRPSDEFELAISLAYFALAEELLVERDSKDFNIATRFKRHVSDAKLRNLLTEDINIRDKEVDGNTPEWFLAALRNGIIHNGFTVDYENRVINVLNNGALNKLDCSVTFDWFKKFIMDDLLLDRSFDTYKYTIVLNPFIKPESAKHLNTFNDIRDFIEKDLPAYDVEVFFDEEHGDTTKIEREEFILFCGDRETLFWKLQNTPEDLSQEELARLEKHKSIVEAELASEKASISEEEYNKRYYSKLFNYWFTEEFKNKYPNYNIRISDFDRKSPRLNMVVSGMENNELEKQLFPTCAKKRTFFFNTHPVFQRTEIASQMSRMVNYDRVDYLNSLQYLFTMYDMHKDAVKDEYGLSSFMDKVLRRKFKDSSQLQSEYMKSIYDGMSEEGIVYTYDKQITDEIIRCSKYYEDAICVRCRELFDNTDDIDDEERTKIGEILKREFPDIYENVSNEMRSQGLPSDQVLSVYNEGDLYRLCNAKGVINNQMNEIVVGLLYTLGINTYVVNKETKFDELTSTDYSFMDGLNITGYSKDVYSECSQRRNARKKNNEVIKRIDRTLPGINHGISISSDLSEVAKKRNQVAEMLVARQAAVNDNQVLNAYLDGRVDETFGNVQMTSLTNLECATTIRNCFAHSGRIFVEGREPGGEVKLVLTDYDENGNLSGVVKTDLSSMIQFFGNPVFKNELDKKGEVLSDVSEKSK